VLAWHFYFLQLVGSLRLSYKTQLVTIATGIATIAIVTFLATDLYFCANSLFGLTFGLAPALVDIFDTIAEFNAAMGI
jgi:hypothetical protein